MTGYQNRHIPFIAQSLYGVTHLCNSPRGSSPLIGSSRTRRSGSPTSASPIPRRASFQGKKCFRFFSFRSPSSPTVSKISSMYPFSEYQTIHILFQVCICIHVAIQPRCFNQTPHTRTNPLQFFSFTPEHLNLSGCRSCKSTDHLQAGRLSRTVPSDKSIDSTLFM